VLAKVKQYIDNPELFAEEMDKAETNESRIDRLREIEAELADICRRRDNLYDVLESGELSPDDRSALLKRLSNLDERRREREREQQSLILLSQRIVAQPDRFEQYQEALHKRETGWTDSDWHDVLVELIYQVRVRDGEEPDIRWRL